MTLFHAVSWSSGAKLDSDTNKYHDKCSFNAAVDTNECIVRDDDLTRGKKICRLQASISRYCGFSSLTGMFS